MKKLLMILIAINTMACSQYTFSTTDAINNIKEDIDDLKQRITVIENIIQSNIYTINSLSQALTSIQSILSELDSNDTQQANDIIILNAQIQTLQSLITNLQNNTNTNTTSIAQLNGYKNISEIVDPCGDDSGYDEVLLRLTDGTLIASFSENTSGKNTRFSILTPNDSQLFMTTDGTNCTFKIPATGVNANKVCWGPSYETCR